MTHKLSKSKILSGLQCEKRLWLEVHKPALAVVDDGAEYRFAEGHKVNEVACSLHKNGHLIGLEKGFSHALAATERMLSESPDTPLFEATFAHHGVLVRTDILEKTACGYRMIEVKSATSVKPQYFPDCAVQAWVLEGNGLPVERMELAHIDNRFVYGGDGDYHGLFSHVDVAGEVRAQQREVPQLVEQFKEVLAGDEPNIQIGDHCRDPYSCPFIEYCSGPQPDYPVTCLPHGKQVAAQLATEGIADIRDIPPGRLGNENQEWVRQVTVNGEADLNPAAREIIIAYSYPRYYLDFETISFALPIWKDTRPYQALPFQWSCHVEAEPGTLTHREFLNTTGEPPMRAFIESLLQAVGESGPIFVYSHFEKTRLRELADRFPDLRADIETVIARLADLLPLTKENYYHPDMRGSWSLKAVLPTVAPNLDYGDLGEVRDGGAAGVAYQEIIHPDTDAARAEALAADLRAYCKRDTEALVALVRFLSTGETQ